MDFYNKISRFYSIFTNKRPRRHRFNFEVHVIDNCNLNCKGCFHFAPLAKSNSIYPLADFKRDIEHLSKLFKGKFGWIHVMGGEPLLNKDITSYLEVVGKNVKRGKVELVTNGMLIPKMDETFFEVVNKYHIKISVTRYPYDIDYETIFKVLDEHHVNHSYFLDKTIPDSFCNMSLVDKSNFSYKKHYLSCLIANGCVTLERGRLTYCSAPAYIHIFNEYYGLSFDDSNDFISIYNHSKKEILDFLRTPHPFCRYCDVKYRDTHLVKWGISKKDKAEWMK